MWPKSQQCVREIVLFAKGITFINTAQAHKHYSPYVCSLQAANKWKEIL